MSIDPETVIRLAREAAGEPEQSVWGDLYIFETVELERFAAMMLEHGRKPLTDEQIDAYIRHANVRGSWAAPFAEGVRWGIRHHEAAHGITIKGKP